MKNACLILKKKDRHLGVNVRNLSLNERKSYQQRKLMLDKMARRDMCYFRLVLPSMSIWPTNSKWQKQQTGICATFSADVHRIHWIFRSVHSAFLCLDQLIRHVKLLRNNSKQTSTRKMVIYCFSSFLRHWHRLYRCASSFSISLFFFFFISFYLPFLFDSFAVYLVLISFKSVRH